MTFIPPTEKNRTIDKDQALDMLQNNLDKINQNINSSIDKDNSVEINQAIIDIKDLLIDLWSDLLDPNNPEGTPPNDAAEWFGHLIEDDPIFNALVKLYAKGALTAVLKNFDLIESFINNIVPISTGCLKLDVINKRLQANGIEKLSEKDSKDIWFLQRMCAIIKQSVANLKDFNKDKPIESLVKLVGPILKEYMESIYYAMSRSCDRWNIPPTYHDLHNVLKKQTVYEDKDKAIRISIWDIYPINMEGTLGALHHAWWKKKFYPIKTSFISTRGAFCYWRYAWPKQRYGWSTYTDW